MKHFLKTGDFPSPQSSSRRIQKTDVRFHEIADPFSSEVGDGQHGRVESGLGAIMGVQEPWSWILLGLPLGDVSVFFAPHCSAMD